MLEAKKHNQICLTPDKTPAIENDSKVMLRSAAVAVVRSSNERGVKRAKLSKLIERGMQSGQSWKIDFLCDVWEAWTFRCNFTCQNFQ